jgi:hypothetical protein
MADVKREPAHVHVSKDDKTVKYWLEPLRMARGSNFGFARHELRQIEQIITDHYSRLLGKWNEAKGQQR